MNLRRRRRRRRNEKETFEFVCGVEKEKAELRRRVKENKNEVERRGWRNVLGAVSFAVSFHSHRFGSLGFFDEDKYC